MIFKLNNSSRLQKISEAPTVGQMPILTRKPDPAITRPERKPAPPVKPSNTDPKWILILGMGD